MFLSFFAWFVVALLHIFVALRHAHVGHSTTQMQQQQEHTESCGVTMHGRSSSTLNFVAGVTLDKRMRSVNVPISIFSHVARVTCAAVGVHNSQALIRSVISSFRRFPI